MEQMKIIMTLGFCLALAACGNPAPVSVGNTNEPPPVPTCQPIGAQCSVADLCCPVDSNAPYGAVCTSVNQSSIFLCHAVCYVNDDCASGMCGLITGQNYGGCL